MAGRGPEFFAAAQVQKGNPSTRPLITAICDEREFFAGCTLLMKMLQETLGVFPVLARDGWPKNPKTFGDARSLVFYMDGGSGQPRHSAPEVAGESKSA